MITAYADVFAEKLARLEARIAGLRSYEGLPNDDFRVAVREAEAARLRRVLRDLEARSQAEFAA